MLLLEIRHPLNSNFSNYS